MPSWGGGILVQGLTNPAFASNNSTNEAVNYSKAFTYTKLSADIVPVISISAPSSGILTEHPEDPDKKSDPITPTPAGTLATYQEVVSVSTNNSTGYKLYMNMIGTTATNNNALNHTSSTTIPKPSIPSITESTTLSNFPNNHWGYYAIPVNNNNSNNANSSINTNSIDTNEDATYSPLPPPVNSDPTTTGHKLNEKEAMITDDTTTVNFATKVNMETPGGTYNNTVLYTAIANTVPQPTIFKVHYDKNGGQNVPQDQEYTASDPTETSHEFQLTDPPKEDIPFRLGFTFGGYTTVKPDPDKNINNQAGAYSPGSQIYLTTTNPEVTLYAIWIPNEEIGFNNSGITTMQQMTAEICNNAPMYTEGRLQDTRDYKVYSVVKLRMNKDSDEGGRCWMSQNLSLDIRADKAYTPADTNIESGTEWKPGESQSVSKSTIPAGKLNSSTWQNDTNRPYSYNPADSYFVTSGSSSRDSGVNNGSIHYTVGNLYNWPAAKASNNTSDQTSISSSSNDSVCPKGWTLPDAKSDPSDFGKMLYAQKITTNGTGSYDVGGFNLIRSSPVYWVRAGRIDGGAYYDAGSVGFYWSGIAYTSRVAYNERFYSTDLQSRYGGVRYDGWSLRCLAQESTNPPTPTPDPSNDSSNNAANGGFLTNNYNDSNAGSDIDSNNYSDPQGVYNTSLKHFIENGGPNWFLFILLLVLAVLTLGVSLFIFYRKRKQEQK